MKTQEVFRYVTVSGGKDSSAVYAWAVEQFGPTGFRAVHVDTTHEHPVTENYVKNMHTIFGGPKVEIVVSDFAERLKNRGKKPSLLGEKFADLITWKGRAPSAKAQFCTEHLKLEPIRKWVLEHRGDLPSIGYVGIRWEESLKRKNMKREMLNEYMDSLTIHPIIDWTELQVINYVKSQGELNPLYGSGSARVGCYPCIHARKSELASMSDWAWERLARYEKTVNRTWFAFGTIPLTPQQKLELAALEAPFPVLLDKTGKDINKKARSAATREWKAKNSPTLEQVRAWSKTLRGGKERDFDATERDVPSCMSTWGICE